MKEGLEKQIIIALHGNIEGEIKLKRQYFFTKDGELENVMDIDITTNDEMLQPFLAANSDTRLKNIISTIQAEQNRIIRSEMWRPLVVQGVARKWKNYYCTSQNCLSYL